jgi:hypothetical protein
VAAAPTIDLIFFDSCPHVDAARANLRAALAAAGLAPAWHERNQTDPALASEWRRFPSPTVLVNSVDVAGPSTASGSACCAAGAPTVAMIRSALLG